MGQQMGACVWRSDAPAIPIKRRLRISAAFGTKTLNKRRGPDAALIRGIL